MLIDIVAGARPNFMKIAPILEAIGVAQQEGIPLEYRLIHTGQHYDPNMSAAFFEQLGIAAPHVNLQVGSGTQAAQAAAIMVGYEKVLFRHRPHLLLVVGDVTSTMACAITAKKMGSILVAHVEAGMRSGDLSMPEEINRLVTDALTDFFFTTTRTATANLRSNGVPEEHIFFVGNTMIDTLLQNKHRFEAPPVWKQLGLQAEGYFVLTLHRSGNVDDPRKLQNLLQTVVDASRGLPILFPVHPRTARMLSQIHLQAPHLHLLEPLGYLQFNYLVQHAKAVITDSGGVAEETTVLHVPCLTLRANTERPETCTIGTNQVVGTSPEAIEEAFEKLFTEGWVKGDIPEKWDGKAAKRIVECLVHIFEARLKPTPACV